MIRAMIVDDEKTLRMMLRKMIERTSDQIEIVAEASDGRNALRILEQAKPDLIFLDLQMPVMGGFEFLENASLDTKTQVVLSTGDQAFALKAYEFGITDYLLKPYSLQRLKTAVERVIKRKNEADEALNAKTDSLMLRLLKFMYSREIDELKPIADRNSLMGYHYPFLNIHYDFDKEQEAFTLLEKLEKAGYLSSTFQESVYTCNHCSNSYLNIREICSKCNSSDLMAEDILHHFSCGYVGPLSDFRDENENNALICPKCDKGLRHIGVDYDKPSAMYHCNNCGAESQNPALSSKCMNCMVDSPVESLVLKQIYSYEITEYAKILVKSGVNVRVGQKEGGLNQFNLTKGGIFERSVKKEILRKKHAEFDSIVCLLQIKDFELIANKVQGDELETLYNDLQSILFNDLDPLAELEISRPDKAFVLVPEMNSAKAKELFTRIKSRLELLLDENFSNHSLKVSFVIKDITEEDTFNELISGLIHDIGLDTSVD